MTVNFKKDSGRMLMFAIFFLALSTTLLSLSACVVAGERGPYYREPRSEAGPRPVDLRRIEGQWFTNVDNNTGKLQFYRSGNMWGGRIWFDVWQQWEDLTDIYFDTRTGRLEFTRPGAHQRYSGTLSDNQILGTYLSEGKSYSWEARRGTDDLRIVEGSWSINANNNPGTLEFYWTGSTWAGRIWFDVWQRWEDLTDIIFDPRTGYLGFTRPGAGQRFSGTLTRNQIVGTYVWERSTYSWEARRELVRPAIAIEGQWLITANNSPGKLEFSRVGKAWGGRIWFDVWGQWEALTDIRFNARTGELQFARPGANQIFSGTLSGNQIVGNYLWGGSTYSWQGRRP